jgi:hypothetical protein
MCEPQRARDENDVLARDAEPGEGYTAARIA